MLANVLPGLREVRAPLLGGYLWLFALWLVYYPQVRGKTEDYVVLASIGDVAEAGTPIAVGVAVSVIAYLVGSLTDGTLQGARKTVAKRYAPEILADPDYAPSIRAYSSMEILADGIVKDAERRLGARNAEIADLPDALFGDAFSLDVAEDDRSPERLSSALQADIVAELPLVATRLMVESPELYASSDRLRAEAQLRFSVALALPAVLLVAAMQYSALWALGGIACAIFYSQAQVRARESSDLLVDALLIGKVEAPAAQRLHKAVDELVEG